MFRPILNLAIIRSDTIIGEKNYTIYGVSHNSVTNFKNPQPINHSTHHGSSHADRERNSPSFFYIFHRCSMCPLLVIRQTSMR